MNTGLNSNITIIILSIILTEIYNFLGSIHFKGVIMDGVLLHFYYLVSLYFILYMHVYMCAFVSMSVYE